MGGRSVIPSDTTGLPLAFAGPPAIGLGVWRAIPGAHIGEFASLAVVIRIFVWYAVKKQRQQASEDRVNARSAGVHLATAWIIPAVRLNRHFAAVFSSPPAPVSPPP
ncbi:MAG: hypothetical protein HPY76_07535 [Anaerolineae bacterium]|nr:hypothetical protein [Anaerolineae bacterium]